MIFDDNAMRFENVEPTPRDLALERLNQGDGLARARTLVSLAYHDSDWPWVQDLCLSLLGDPDAGVRATAALSLGHLARIHKTLDLERVLPALHRLQDDPEIGWRVADVIDDIDMFVD